MVGLCRGAGVALKILAISGSLRAASSNSAVLRVASRVAPMGIEVIMYDGIDRLPYFNPDLDREFDDPLLPASVRELRAAIAASDALLISSPEYAHGVPGVLKNALDWLVGGPEMVGKRIALFNTSPHATHAQASLAETLRTMSVAIIAEASIAIPLPRGESDDALVASEEVSRALRAALAMLVAVSD
ncbi:MAG: NADPH-dependent reductase [Gemmatimonadetes bacterium]|nr:NADPH-dependent reductase [Gemmatimonadota bacterium]